MAAEVDPSTASFVINGKGDKLRISRTTQARILAAARQLGYQSPFRRLSDGPSQSENAVPENRQIGLILSLTSPVESLALIPGLEPTLFAAGYQLEVVSLPADPTAAKARMLKTGFAGLICCRTIYSAVSAIVAGKCPTIVLWEGAGKAILNAVGGNQFSVGSELGVTSKPIAETPKPIPAAPPPITTPTPVPKPEPITRPEPTPVSEPVSPPIRETIITPKPVIATETILTPEPIATEDHAADTAATTEINPILVVTEEERAAPVVTGVSPVEPSDQDTTQEPSPVSVDPEPVVHPSMPEPSDSPSATPEAVPATPETPPPQAETPEPTPEPIYEPEPAPVSEPEPTLTPVVDPIEITPITVDDPAADTAATTEINPILVVTEEERAAPVVTGVSPVKSSDQDTTPEPVPTPTPVAVPIAEPEPESPPPSPVADLPPAVSPPPATAAPVEPPPIIPAPAPVVVAPPTETPAPEAPAIESLPAVDEPPIDPDLPTSESESQATDPAADQEPTLQ